MYSYQPSTDPLVTVIPFLVQYTSGLVLGVTEGAGVEVGVLAGVEAGVRVGVGGGVPTGVEVGVGVNGTGVGVGVGVPTNSYTAVAYTQAFAVVGESIVVLDAYALATGPDQ